MQRSMTLARDTALLVRIVTLEGDEFDEVAALPADELTAHLAQWDYGTENDGAATINGYDTIDEAQRFGAQTSTHGGLEYWLAVDHGLRMCSLLRRPLTKNAQEGWPMKTLTENEFDTQFTTVPDADGDVVRPSDHGLDLASTKLWTIVDGDDGSLVILSGRHYVNRIGYVITEEDWAEPTEAVWFPASEDEEDEPADEG